MSLLRSTTTNFRTYSNSVYFDYSSLYYMLSDKNNMDTRKEIFRELFKLYKTGGGMSDFAMERRKIEICYDLYNGNGFAHSKAFIKDSIKQEPFGLPKNIKYRHFPILAPVAKHRVGVYAGKPTTYTVMDTSGYAANLVKQKINGKVSEWLNASIVQPTIQQLFQQELQANNISDPFMLKPEQRDELMNVASQKAETMLPEEIFDRFAKEYSSPLEVKASKFQDFLYKEYKQEQLFREGYKHMTISGGVLFKQGIKNNKPYLENMNILKAEIYKKPEERYFENAEAIVYRDQLTPVEFLTQYYPYLDKKEQKNAEYYFADNMQGHPNDVQGRFMGAVTRGDIPMGSNSMETDSRDGMRNYLQLLGRANALSGITMKGSMPIVHGQIRGQRRIKEVYRLQESGEVKVYYCDEDYVMQPQQGDIKYAWTWIDEIWEVTEIMGSVFTDERPVPYQYVNTVYPFNKVPLSYSGGWISQLQGNTANTSSMMPAIPMQYSYDLHYSLLDKDIANNLGVVLQMMTKALGKKTPEQFMTELKNFKILAVDSEGMGLNDAQLNAIKAINLSNMIDIEARRRTLQEIKNDAVIVMNYNPDKLGYASPYKSNLSVENSIQMSNTQTLDEEKNYDLIVQNVMQNFYDMAVQVYGDNPLNTRFVNSDGDKAILELSKNDFTDIAEANMNIKIYNSLEAAQKLEQIKMDLLEQNRVNPGFLEPDEVVEVRMTSSVALVLNVSRRAATRRQKQMQQEQQQQQQLQQLLQESMDERERQKQIHEDNLLDKRLTVDKYKAELASDTLRKGFDVDSDGIDNASEAKTIEMQIKERIEKNKEILEYAKLNVEKQKIAKGTPRK